MCLTYLRHFQGGVGVLRADGYQLMVCPADEEGVFIPVGGKAHHSTANAARVCIVFLGTELLE